MEITDMDLQVLSETGNIGIGHATTALSLMMNKKRVELGLPDAKVMAMSSLEDDGIPLIAASHKIAGDFSGFTVLAMPDKDLRRMIDLVSMKEIGSTLVVDKEGFSVIREVSNIIVGAYLNSIAKMIGDVSLLPEPPVDSVGSLANQIKYCLGQLNESPEQVISVNTAFSVDGQPLNGSLLLLFDGNSVGVFLQKLKDKYNY